MLKHWFCYPVQACLLFHRRKAVQEAAVAGEEAPSPAVKAATLVAEEMTQVKEQLQPIASNEKRFYSPLVKNIAAQENIPINVLAAEIDVSRDPDTGLASAIRVFVLNWYRNGD